MKIESMAGGFKYAFSDWVSELWITRIKDVAQSMCNVAGPLNSSEPLGVCRW